MNDDIFNDLKKKFTWIRFGQSTLHSTISFGSRSWCNILSRLHRVVQMFTVFIAGHIDVVWFVFLQVSDSFSNATKISTRKKKPKKNKIFKSPDTLFGRCYTQATPRQCRATPNTRNEIFLWFRREVQNLHCRYFNADRTWGGLCYYIYANATTIDFTSYKHIWRARIKVLHVYLLQFVRMAKIVDSNTENTRMHGIHRVCWSVVCL